MYNIAVIGCGVIGLTSALAIQKRLGPSVKVTIFTEALSPNTTGDVAAGLWLPYLIQDTPKEDISKWAQSTKNYIMQLWKNGEANKAGISLQLITKISSAENYETPAWVNAALGYAELTKQQIDYYSRKYDKKYSGGFSLVSFIWEASVFLPYLQEQFLENGGDIKIKRIESFEQLNTFDVIVNCTGINSKDLVPDSTVRPIRGQIIRVLAPWQFDTFNEDNSYIIPNQRCVILGGTQQIDDYNLNIDVNDRQQILNGCGKYSPALKSAKIVNDCVGLRPGRNKIRVELEYRQMGIKVQKIIHNYGHGGSGITLSIGCAETAAELVEEALKSKSKL